MKSKTLLFLNLLWIFTIVYFCFGRFNWEIPSYAGLIVYILVNYCALNLGYYTAPSGNIGIPKLADAELDEDRIFYQYRRPFAVACIMTMVFQVLWVITFLGEFSILNIFEVIGENYFERLNVEFEGASTPMQIRTLLWLVTYFVFPMGFMFFKSMPRRYKLLFVVTVFVEVFASLNMGVSKNMGDLVLIYVAVLFLKTTAPYKNTNGKTKGMAKTFWKVAIIVAVFLAAFSIVQSTRDAASQVVENPFKPFAQLREFAVSDVLSLGNKTLASTLDKMGYYVSHGYCGLAYALTLPFKSTYGLGFSRGFMEYAEQYLKLPLSHLTYNHRIDALYGWLDGRWWPTAFVWYGNAISLWLVPVLMFFLGRIFRNAERRWYGQKQIVSLVVFCQLFISFVYLSCNAQIVQARQTAIATTCLAVLYFAKNVLRIRVRWR